MSISKLTYYKQVEGILKNKRKMQTYNVKSELMVEIPEIKKDETKLVATAINYAHTEGSTIKEFVSHNGKIYEPLYHKRTSDEVGYLREAIMGVMENTNFVYSDIPFVKVEGMTHEEFDDYPYGVSDLCQLQSGCETVEEDDFKTIQSDNDQYKVNLISKHISEHYLFIDGHLFVESIGPTMRLNGKNEIEYESIWVPSLLRPGQHENRYRGDKVYPVSMVCAFEDPYLIKTDIKEHENYCKLYDDAVCPEVIVFDMDALNTTHQDIVGPMLYDMCFGEILQDRLTKKHYGKVLPETDLTNYLESIYQKYPFGEVLASHIEECKKSGYDFEVVKNTILFLSSHVNSMSNRENTVDTMKANVKRTFFSDQFLFTHSVGSLANKMDKITDYYYNKVDKPSVFITSPQKFAFCPDKSLRLKNEPLKP